MSDTTQSPTANGCSGETNASRPPTSIEVINLHRQIEERTKRFKTIRQAIENEVYDKPGCVLNLPSGGHCRVTITPSRDALISALAIDLFRAQNNLNDAKRKMRSFGIDPQ